jgi:hypothetical protein
MIGLIIALFIPALISLLLVSIFNNKVKAKKACAEFEIYLSKYGQQFQLSVSQIVENKTYDYNDGVIEAGTSLHLISRDNSKIKMYAINNQNSYVFSEKKYTKLMAKLKKNRITISYSIDSFSLYYRCNAPFDKNILKLDYPQKVFDPTTKGPR